MDDPGRQPRLFQDRNRPERRFHSRLIAVIGQQHLVGITLQNRGLLRRKSSPQRRHSLRKARLMHGDHVHISFTEDHIGLPAHTRQIQSVEVPALIEDPGLRRIQILGLSISHDSAAEADDTVMNIHNRKNNAVPELVIHAPLLIHLHQPGLLQYLVPVAFAL